MVDLVDIVPLNEGLESNPWAWGPYCWRVANPRRFAEPIPAKGKLNLYSLTGELAELASKAVASAGAVKRDAQQDAWIQAMINLEDENTRIGDLLDAYLQLEDITNALRLAEQSVLRIGDAQSYLNRAYVKGCDGHPNQAIADINVAIDKDPTMAHAYFLRNLAYQDLGKPDIARQDFDKAVELDPAYAEEDS